MFVADTPLDRFNVFETRANLLVVKFLIRDLFCEVLRPNPGVSTMTDPGAFVELSSFWRIMALQIALSICP